MRHVEGMHPRHRLRSQAWYSVSNRNQQIPARDTTPTPPQPAAPSSCEIESAYSETYDGGGAQVTVMVWLDVCATRSARTGGTVASACTAAAAALAVM